MDITLVTDFTTHTSAKKAKAKIKNKTKNRVEKTSLMGLKYELKKALHEVSFNHKYFNHEINSEIFKQI